MRVGSWLASIALLGSLAACAPPPKPPTFPTFTADQLPPNPVFVSLPASQAAANLAAALKCGTDSRGGTVHLDTAAVDGTSTILTGLGSGDEAGLSLR